MSGNATRDPGSFMDNKHKCPRCNAILLANSKAVWCSYVKCRYGLDEHIPKNRYFAGREIIDRLTKEERQRMTEVTGEGLFQVAEFLSIRLLEQRKDFHAELMEIVKFVEKWKSHIGGDCIPDKIKELARKYKPGDST